MGEGSELETQLPRVVAYRRQNALGMGQNVVIAEPEDGPAEVFQLHLSEVVSQDDVVALMNPAVDLDDQP